MRPDEIEGLIREGLPGTTVRVSDETGGGDHFRRWWSPRPLPARVWLNDTNWFTPACKAPWQGASTALSLKTYTPEEWTAQQ